MDTKPLPASVQEIADVIGREQALHLVANLPRRSDNRPGKACKRPMLYVPQRITMDHKLVAILGFEDAAKMVNAFGGENLYPATCSENKGGRPKKNTAVESEPEQPENVATVHSGVFHMLFPFHGSPARV
jgi:hypothetical protein